MKKIFRWIIAGILIVAAVFYGIMPVDLMLDPILLDDIGIFIAVGIAIRQLVVGKKDKEEENEDEINELEEQ